MRPSYLVGLMVAFIAAQALAFLYGNTPKALVQLDPANARHMCSQIAEELQRSSSNWAIVGWQLALVSALLGAIGGLVGRGSPTETRWYRIGAGALLATLGTSLSATAAVSIARSNAASSAAAAATFALKVKDDTQAYEKCLDAKAQWLESRVDSLDQLPPPGKRSDQIRSTTDAQLDSGARPPVGSASGNDLPGRTPVPPANAGGAKARTGANE
jgi:hypothetical protein